MKILSHEGLCHLSKIIQWVQSSSFWSPCCAALWWAPQSWHGLPQLNVLLHGWTGHLYTCLKNEWWIGVLWNYPARVHLTRIECFSGLVPPQDIMNFPDFGNSNSPGVNPFWKESPRHGLTTYLRNHGLRGRVNLWCPLEGVVQGGLTSWSGFTLGEALVSRLISQRLLESG